MHRLGHVIIAGQDGVRALFLDAPTLLLDLKLLLLVIVANGAALIGHTLFPDRWTFPLDAGARFVDGRPMFGESKTLRGFVMAAILTPVAALVLYLPAFAGFLIGVFAMVGDVFSSFIKRRLGLDPHSKATGIDQVPESLFPLLAVQPMFNLSPGRIVVLVIAFWVAELAISRVLYRLRLRETPY
jgi:hypothetical protein